MIGIGGIRIANLAVGAVLPLASREHHCVPIAPIKICYTYTTVEGTVQRYTMNTDFY